jgi:hypothetical protein
MDSQNLRLVSLRVQSMNFLEGATTRERNQQIGGHRSGDNPPFRSSNEDEIEDWDELP